MSTASICLHKDLSLVAGSADIRRSPLQPFAPQAVEFLSQLSKLIMNDDSAKLYSDIISFGFWCRKSNLEKMKDRVSDQQTRLGLGMAFHIAPSNVPLNFAYSYAMGLLSGNSNIVRIPSKKFEQVEITCKLIHKLLCEEPFKEIREMSAFVSYAADDEITGLLSSQCNARIIWGGDETIRSVRKQPISERSVEMSFSDRYSLCLLNSDSVQSMSEGELAQLASGFYNDTYLMDQNACSSPHLIVWTGNSTEPAKLRFWNAVSKLVSEKYSLEPIMAVDKYTKLCEDALQLSDTSSLQHDGSRIYRVLLTKLPENLDQLRGRFGYFYEYEASSIDEIAVVVNSRYQTLTYLGFEKESLKNFVIQNRLLGIDRIVPVGKALDIDIFWDGYDVVRTLSRVINV